MLTDVKRHGSVSYCSKLVSRLGDFSMLILFGLALKSVQLPAGKARLSHSVITADLDGDGREDKASVFTNQVSGLSVVMLELATGRSLPVYAVPARVGAKLSHRNRQIMELGMDIPAALPVKRDVVRADSNDRRTSGVVRKDCLARENA